MSPRVTVREPASRTARRGDDRRIASLRDPAGDVALAVAVAAASLLLLTHGGLGPPAPQSHELDLTRTLLVAATALPLVWWRRWPIAVFIVVGAASVALAARGDVIWPPVGLAAALYLIASRRGDNAAWTPAKWVAVGGVLLAYTGFATGDLGEFVHNVIAFATAWFAGERTRLRRAQLAALRDRAERAEQDAARERELAIAEERSRIARDLHDSAAHALNVIAVRAGAARLRHDPDRDLAALTAIEELARQTMTDIDHVVGALRNPHADGAVEVPPGLAALDSLLAQHRAAGHRVDLVRTGEQRPLPAPVDHGAYRILQEALTNAARYGTGTTRTDLSYRDDTLDLDVRNTIRPAPAPGTENGGHGLIGMRERAVSLGGRLSAEASGKRFRVRAQLPYSGRAR